MDLPMIWILCFIVTTKCLLGRNHPKMPLKVRRSRKNCVSSSPPSSFSSSSSSSWLPSAGRIVFGLLTGMLILHINNSIVLGMETPCEILEKQDFFLANCSRSNLTFIPNDLLKNIRQLDLSHNHIVLTEPVQRFHAYDNIKTLSIVNNSINTINPSSFIGLKLEVLELSGNLLTNVPREALSMQEFLRNLSLENNRIDHIRSDDFFSLHRLIELKLSGNHIKSLDGMSLGNLKHLQHLELSHNFLPSLPHNLFQSCNESLQRISLSQNPWYCDCHLRWLQEYFLLKNWTSLSTGLRCQRPLSLLQYQLFTSIPWNQFACPLVMDSSSTKLTYAEGDNVSLICRVQSDPPAEISWLFNDKPIPDSGLYNITDSVGINGMSVLQLTDFGYDSIGRYRCLAENPASNNSITYTLVLDRADYLNHISRMKPVLSRVATKKAPSSVNSVVTIVGIVVGTVSLCLVSVLLFLYWRRFTRLQAQKQEEIKIQIKNHFESSRNSSSSGSNDTSKGLTIEEVDTEETDPLYNTVKPGLQPQQQQQQQQHQHQQHQQHQQHLHEPSLSMLPHGQPTTGYIDLQEMEAYSPSTLMTTMDSSDNNGVFWTGSSRNPSQCSPNPSDIACPLLETTPGYFPSSYPNDWDLGGHPDAMLTSYLPPSAAHSDYMDGAPHSISPYPPAAHTDYVDGGPHCIPPYPAAYLRSPYSEFEYPPPHPGQHYGVPSSAGYHVDPTFSPMARGPYVSPIPTSWSSPARPVARKSASVCSVGSESIPPKKPPRVHSERWKTSSSLPRPGSVDEFGTAV